jgi:adenylate cyclase
VSSSSGAVFRAGKTAFVSAVVVLLFAFSGVTERTDRWWFDHLQALGVRSASIPADTALVLIDENSLSTMGQPPFSMRWPWPRSAFAALLAGLHAAGAEQIVVDLIFFESSAAAEQDLLLGVVAAGIPGAILAAVPERLPAVWPDEFRNRYPKLFEGRTKWGMVHSSPDSDSVIRRYPLTGSLARAAMGLAISAELEPDPPVLLRWRGNLEQLRGRGVSLLSAAQFVVAGWEILDQATQMSPDLDPVTLMAAIHSVPALTGEGFDQVRGKTVFIGANAAATFDAIATPLGAPEPGVILHWNAFANLKSGNLIQAMGPAVSWAVALVVIVLLSLSGRAGTSLLRPALVAAVLLLVTIAGSAGLFFVDLWFAPGLSIMAAATGFTAVAVESFRAEQARKQEIQSWFGAYVSPSFVNRLVADPHAIELGGEQKELTILFSDIAGFTSISEGLEPTELVSLINRFLEGQTERILDQGGYLDKYIGDAVMAVFGSPEPLDNHALQACKAALACRVALHELNDEIESKYGMRIGMRTGINTGDVVVGNVGSTRKRNYTVLGDAVNLASRLEGANKQTGTSILLGPLTAKSVAGAMVLRPVARLQVKGKTQAVEVFELMAERADCDATSIRFSELFAAGFSAYCEQNFSRAAMLFKQAMELRSGDLLSVHYLDDAEKYEARPPEPDWHGVLKLETK